MPLHLERIDWMPSPPLAPDDGPIDIEHLKRMTLGDASLEREVLAMFSAQAVGLIGALATLPADAGALAHTLKGSARAIGAFRVADAAECSGSRDPERRRSGPRRSPSSRMPWRGRARRSTRSCAGPDPGPKPPGKTAPQVSLTDH